MHPILIASLWYTQRCVNSSAHVDTGASSMRTVASFVLILALVNVARSDETRVDYLRQDQADPPVALLCLPWRLEAKSGTADWTPARSCARGTPVGRPLFPGKPTTAL